MRKEHEKVSKTLLLYADYLRELFCTLAFLLKAYSTIYITHSKHAFLETHPAGCFGYYNGEYIRTY